MKNTFKIASVALALATTFTACGGNSASEKDATIIDSEVVADSNIMDDTMDADTGAKM